MLEIALGTPACRDSAGAERARDDADHERLAKIVLRDEALDRAMKAAEDQARAGSEEKGAILLETDATRAADEAIFEGEHAKMETPWGAARRDALLSIIRERRASLPSYAEAMRGESLESKLLVVTLQIDLQKRALEVAGEALAPTPTSPQTAAAKDAG